MSLEAHIPALPVIVPLLAAPIAAYLRPRHLAWAAATLASIASFAIAVLLALATRDGSIHRYAMGGWPAPFGIELAIDSLGALVLLIITGASTLAIIAGRETIERDIEPHRQPLFYAAWLMVVAGLAGIAITGDAFNVFVFMEISSLATYVVIAAGSDRQALTAVFKYLIMGTIGATFYLIGVGFVYMMTGTLNFADMQARLADIPYVAPVHLAAAFIIVGLALKAAVFPLHAWLPNAYAHAPHAVTAFIAACSTKVTILVLLRFDFVVFMGNIAEHATQFALFVMPLALLGILFGSGVAIFETNVKRLLGYSSIAQLGYILLGASFVDRAGLLASVLHIFNHALAKGALFLAIVALGHHLTRFEIRDLHGIGRRMPWTLGAFSIAALSLVGVPGTAGFISKWYLIVAAFGQGSLGLVLVGVIVASSLMAVVYLWRILEPAWFAAADPVAAGAADDKRVGEAPVGVLAVVLLAAALNVWFGLVPAFPLELAGHAADELLRHVP
ncbi:MAG: monovalent cation/H+ antiporter subunit D family protein [Pseudomonadales bacterium]|nr:monovalent cation/H+ antiporter subunit D family protein [Pseudomonadales bacterium]